MKKFLLAVFILIDLALIGGSIFFLYTYLMQRNGRPASSSAVQTPVPGSSATASISTAAVSATVSSAAASGQSGTQTKVFSYRNSHAKRVAIRADFTGWKAELMQRDAAGVWTYKIPLSPGEYAYCYSVDDKPPLKDPINKRTKTIGRAVVSAIVVEAPPLKK
jgi:hypothetical protein